MARRRARGGAARRHAALTRVRVRPNATVYFAINNLGAKGYDRYLQTTDRPREHIITPRSLQLGITGQF